MKTLLPLLLAFLLCGAAARESAAQVGYTASSVEWTTDAADRVVRASVRDLQFRDAPPLYSTDRWQWVTVTLAVQETLKGETGNRLVFTVRRTRDDRTLRDWRASGQSLLWFLKRRGREPNDFTGPESAWDAPSGTAANKLAVELGGREHGGRLLAPVLAMDLALLQTDSALLDAVRKEARYRKSGGLTEQHGVSIPRELMAKTGRSGDANALVVPVDARLEALAHRWMTAGEPTWKRMEGISALRHFRTPAQEALLLGLLEDPESSTVVDYDPDGKLYHWRVHYLREAAYRVLKEWNVPVSNPPHRERLEEYVPQ